MEGAQVPVLDLFLSYFKPQVVEDMFRAVVDTYPQTARQLRLMWSGSEGVDLRPHVQRANVIQTLRAVGEKHRGSGVIPKDIFNVSRTSRNIMLVGGAGSITPHYIPARDSAVRNAAYRRILCSPNILDLFTLEGVEPDTPLHAYLVHGCDGLKAYQRVDREAPDFVYVRFPIVGGGVYAAQSLDLMEMFPHVLDRDRSSAVDHVIEIEDVALPKLRPDQQTGDAG
ncbi:MAG TPA: hypothetical protein VGR37_08495 [Longimicrobiaceae bacterium]|nr:hypothetical protein [Longimicrobiaceae bacterium]